MAKNIRFEKERHRHQKDLRLGRCHHTGHSGPCRHPDKCDGSHESLCQEPKYILTFEEVTIRSSLILDKNGVVPKQKSKVHPRPIGGNRDHKAAELLSDSELEQDILVHGSGKLNTLPHSVINIQIQNMRVPVEATFPATWMLTTTLTRKLRLVQNGLPSRENPPLSTMVS